MSQTTLLIVEDNDTHQYVMKHLCEHFNYVPTFVKTGEAALETLLSIRFSAVFLDLRLPGMTGIETVREIRKLEKQLGTERIPVIAVTASAMPEDKAACMAAGFDDFLSKPFLLEDFRTAIERWTQAATQ